MIDLHLGSRNHSVHIWKRRMQGKCFPGESFSAVGRAEDSGSGVRRIRWPGRVRAVTCKVGGGSALRKGSRRAVVAPRLEVR